MRLGSKDDGRSPRPFARADPIVMAERINLFEHDLALVDAVAGLTTADWRGGAGVDVELEAEDRAADTFIVKAIPVFLNGFNKGGMQLGREILGDGDVLVELFLIAKGVPKVDIGAGGYKLSGGGTG
jgi:hypothetical protein